MPMPMSLSLSLYLCLCLYLCLYAYAYVSVILKLSPSLSGHSSKLMHRVAVKIGLDYKIAPTPEYYLHSVTSARSVK